MVRALARGLTVLLAAVLVAGCVPVLMGGAVVGTTAVATDRRTAGMQLEDQSIDLRVRSLIANEYADEARVTPSSYNGTVLLVGSVTNDELRSRVARHVANIENVKNVVNQLEVGQPRTVSTATNDSLISGQVRAALIGTADLASGAFVVTTYRGTVYLQGRVTIEEGQKGARVASGLRGVNRVVTLYEIITPEEVRRLNQAAAEANPSGDGTGGNLMQSMEAEAAPAAQGDQAIEEPSTLAIPVPMVR